MHSGHARITTTGSKPGSGDEYIAHRFESGSDHLKLNAFEAWNKNNERLKRWEDLNYLIRGREVEQRLSEAMQNDAKLSIANIR